MAIINAELGTNVGFLTPMLYHRPVAPGTTTLCRPITSGICGTTASSAIFYASSSAQWNACCGLGSPLGNALLAALQTG